MGKTVCIWLLAVWPLWVRCQSSDTLQDQHWLRGAGLTLNRGVVYAQTYHIAHLGGMRTFGLQADVMPRFMISKPWWAAYRYGNVGLSLLVNQNGPSHVLGTSVAVGPFMETFLLKRRRHRLNIRATTGLVWSSNPFDLTDNPQNGAVGATYSALIQGFVHYAYRLSPGLWLKGGVAVTHYSNGSYRMPNFGLNMPALSVGMHYTAEESPLIRNTALPTWQRGWQLEAGLQAGAVENFPVNGPHYMTATASLLGSYRFALKSSFTLGADYMYNTSLPTWVRVEPTWAGKRIDAAGLALGHTLHISRVQLHTQFGFYVYKPFPLYPWLYQRVGIRYYVTPSLSTGIALKLHNFGAETVEATLGYRIWKQR